MHLQALRTWNRETDHDEENHRNYNWIGSHPALRMNLTRQIRKFGADKVSEQIHSSTAHVFFSDILLLSDPVWCCFNIQRVRPTRPLTPTQSCTSHESIYTRPFLIDSLKPGEQELMYSNEESGAECRGFIWFTSNMGAWTEAEQSTFEMPHQNVLHSSSKPHD